MNKDLLVSIIVPCYKVEQYLPNCIESILHQTYNNWELILVDDGSPDNCGQICDDYAKKNGRIKVVHKQNGGLSSARNAGMQVMTGDYVTFVDSDDFLHKDALHILVEYALKYEAQIVQCNFTRGYETAFPEWKGQEKVSEYDNHTVFTQFAAKIIVCGKLYKRELLEDITMPEGIINEDDWTTWKIYYKAKKIVVTNRPLYYYTVNPNSIMGKAKKKPDTTYYGAYDERIAFFRDKNESELEDVSRLQFCKSLLLSYSNKQLTEEQRDEIIRMFRENWKVLKTSAVVPALLRILFFGFTMCPQLASKAASAKRGGVKNRVTIIVPCYNVEKYLPNCIESILNQTYKDWELILVDDGSPDHSGVIADNYASLDVRIKVIHKKNAGVAAARNSAIDIATGEFISFLDGDDFLHVDYIKDLLTIANDSSADIVQCDYVRGKDRVFPSYEDKEILREYDSHSVFVADVAKIIVCGKLIKSDILKTIRIPEGRYFEDDLVTWRWYYAANKTVVTSKPYYYYTENDNSQMAQHKKKPNLSFIEAYDERITFFKETENWDMEACGHRQLCKSLLVTYGNSFLTSDQRSLVLSRFRQSWKRLKVSSVLSVRLRLLFTTFNAMPNMVSHFLKNTIH